eukprot:3855182-Ditylum_brightwellii.AAC.1
MKLFTLVDVDPNKIYYFSTNRSNTEDAIVWLDNLPELLRTTFTFNQICEICKNDDEDPSRSYHKVPTDNTLDA